MTTDRRIGVSVADLAAALEGFEAGFSLADGTNLAGKLLYPKIIAGRLWQVLGEMGLPGPGPDTGTPRFVGELATAIARLGPVRVRVENLTVMPGEADAVILYPGTVAGRLLQALGGEEAARPEACCACGSPEVSYRNYRGQPFCPPCADGKTPGGGPEVHPLDRAGGDADGEASFIASAVARLECIGSEAQRRVLRYLADRYGIED